MTFSEGRSRPSFNIIAGGENMKVEEGKKDCRFWGYEPVSVGSARTGTKTREEKREALAKWQAERAALRAAGYKPQKYGLTKAKAIAEAKALEGRFRDIEFLVFNHDYL